MPSHQERVRRNQPELADRDKAPTPPRPQGRGVVIIETPGALARPPVLAVNSDQAETPWGV